MAAVLKVVFVALSLSLDVFAVSIGVGIRGVPPGVKWRIGIAFACAEVLMNLIGAGVGLAAGRFLGDVAGYIGFVALVALGLYMIKESRSEFSGASKLDLSKGWGLTVASLSISLDSLGIGFSILYIGVPLPISLVIIAISSVLLDRPRPSSRRSLWERLPSGTQPFSADCCSRSPVWRSSA